MNTEAAERHFIADIKLKVRQAQYEPLKAVNSNLINLYWEIGKSIAEKQAENWGKAIVATLSNGLQAKFPRIAGFSAGNLCLMAQIAGVSDKRKICKIFKKHSSLQQSRKRKIAPPNFKILISSAF